MHKYFVVLMTVVLVALCGCKKESWSGFDLGSTCEDNSHCRSGFCTKGRCITRNTHQQFMECTGTCTSFYWLFAANGACMHAPAGSDPNGDCIDAGGTCNGLGACQYPIKMECKNDNGCARLIRRYLPYEPPSEDIPNTHCSSYKQCKAKPCDFSSCVDGLCSPHQVCYPGFVCDQFEDRCIPVVTRPDPDQI